jgi:hypothetical protein
MNWWQFKQYIAAICAHAGFDVAQLIGATAEEAGVPVDRAGDHLASDPILDFGGDAGRRGRIGSRFGLEPFVLGGLGAVRGDGFGGPAAGGDGRLVPRSTA